MTVIPTAVLTGCVGGGFGVVARSAGAYVIKDGAVTWRPAFDLPRTIRLAAAVGRFILGRRRCGIRGRTR